MANNENNEKRVQLPEFVTRNAWALIIVAASVIGQWAVFGVRLDSIEARVERQGTSISDIRSSLAETQNQYAALEAKLEGIDQNVNYIRTRLDAALRNQ